MAPVIDFETILGLVLEVILVSRGILGSLWGLVGGSWARLRRIFGAPLVVLDMFGGKDKKHRKFGHLFGGASDLNLCVLSRRHANFPKSVLSGLWACGGSGHKGGPAQGIPPRLWGNFPGTPLPANTIESMRRICPKAPLRTIPKNTQNPY